MKLRLRSLQTNQTLKLDVPETCTLHQLSQILSGSVPSPLSSSPPRFSLNRKEELLGSSPMEPLRAMGITSGDLIYFSFEPDHISSASRDETLGTASISNSMASVEGNNRAPTSSISGNSIDSAAAAGLDSDNSASDVNLGISSEVPGGSPMLGVDDNMGRDCSKVTSDVDEHVDYGEETHGGEKTDGSDCMDIDGTSSEEVVVSSKRFSEPYFLRRVLREELGDCDSHQKLLVTAIHAVFLESGFVGYDSESGSRIASFQVAADWPLRRSTFSVSYTLPELLGKVVFVALKFQTLGNFVNAFGSLAAGSSKVYHLCLNGNTFAPKLYKLLTNCNNNNPVGEDDESLKGMDSSENEVFKFWKNVKDGLCLPLMIDICEKASLPMPSCFASLPTDVKLSILTLLPGVDMARMELVSKEMCYLSSDNELWKLKFVEEFGREQLWAVYPVANWKQRFATELVSKKKRKRDADYFRTRGGHMMRHVPPNYVGRRHPPIWGGDYDRIPTFSPFLGVHPFPFTQHAGPMLGGRRMARDVRTLL